MIFDVKATMKLKVYDLRKNFLILSILCHLLGFLSFLFLQMLLMSHKKEKNPEIDIASYIYQKPMPTQVLTNHETNNTQKNHPQSTANKSKETPTAEQQFANIKQPIFSVDQYKAFVDAKNKELDPVHFIGEKIIEDPLRKLIGIALTKHLIYPNIAGRLGIHGVVTVSILLHPDGRITEIQLIESSREKMLDVAALTAIHDSSPIRDIDIYLHEPRQLIINIIFR